MTVTLVVAMGASGVIGANGEIPWPRTGDQVQFKALTMGHPMIMGRTTFESIGRPLPGRTSIVLTRDRDWSADGVLVAGRLDEALAHAAELHSETFIIGGAQVYATALDDGVVDRMVVTHVNLSPDGDAWFPALDWNEWIETDRETFEGYDIATYDRAGHGKIAS